MSRVTAFLMGLGACLLLAACNSGPSSSGSSSSRPDGAAALERRVEHIEGLLARRVMAAAALEELMSALPDRVWLTDIVYDSGKVQAKGSALSNTLLADYISRLGESPSLANVALRSSAAKLVRGRERQEFALEATVRETRSAPAAADIPPAAQLKDLEKALPARQDSAEILRELQRLALDSGLRMTKFTPGAEVAGEFTRERPVTIEVSGEPTELSRYLKGLANLASLWVVDKFSFKAVSGEDPRSHVRASITAKTYLVR